MVDSRDKTAIPCPYGLYQCNVMPFGLKVPAGWWRYFQTSLKFLAHIVSAAGTQVDAEKIQAVEEYSVPTNLKAVQRFLAVSSLYHQFFPNFSQVGKALNTLQWRNQISVDSARLALTPWRGVWSPRTFLYIQTSTSLLCLHQQQCFFLVLYSSTDKAGDSKKNPIMAAGA